MIGDSFWQDEYEERTAIKCFCGNISKSEAERQARIETDERRKRHESAEKGKNE